MRQHRIAEAGPTPFGQTLDAIRVVTDS
jgi:hypothetical protein